MSLQPKRRQRYPAYVPQWLARRMEVNVYKLFDFMQRLGAAIPPSARVLDAGAGEGRFKPEFQHTHYVGIDLAVGDVEWDYSDLDAVSNLVKMPFAENTFDLVLCNQVLEHVTEPSLVLEEITRVLKPGGRMVLSVPQSWHQHQKPHDFYRYTSFGLRYLIEKAGMNVDHMETMGGYFWFLSFQFQNINYWVFPRGMPGRRWTWPIRAFNGLIFQIILPLILFYLDPLDRIQDETLGYICVGVKPERAA